MQLILKMFKVLLLFILIFFLNNNVTFSQCPSGAIGVSGPGCGCLNGCDLTSFGGPNCSPPVGGNCNAGYIPMSLEIEVPEGCTYFVEAVMESRPGCSASGADGNCPTCDALKVDIPGGTKPMQFGPSNASISDSYSLVGPGVILISGSANRADEIITYNVISSGSACDNCLSILPVELLSFSAERNNRYVDLSWITATEINNDYFTVERSLDGINFTVIGSMPGSGNSSIILNYKLIDSSPIENEISYYRLKQTDFDGAYSYSDIVSVKPLNESREVIGYYNAMGQKVDSESKGVVIVRYSDGTFERRFK